MTFVVLFLTTCFLAYSNGANDNFKGVATLFGSGTTNYKVAIWWATLTTFCGSICSIFLAGKLVKSFSGKGLVGDDIAASPEFLLVVALGAGLTVMLATILGFPISTTHSLVGALTGGGLIATSLQINFAALGSSFFLPLLLSPLIAVCLAAITYVVMRYFRISLGVTQESCVCIGTTSRDIPATAPNLSSVNCVATARVDIAMDTEENCRQRYVGTIMGFNCQKLLEIAHYFSAGVVSFARGLNDTPKIVALLIGFKALGIEGGMIMVAISMAIGGLLNAKKVAETISKKITPLNLGQGFTANMVTGLLVVFASRLGMPVSTTHVSVGSIFGIGLITKEADRRMVLKILVSWVLTLPIAAFLSAAMYLLIQAL